MRADINNRHNALQALPVYPVFEDKIVHAKNRIKTTTGNRTRTDTIATNFKREYSDTFRKKCQPQY